MVQSDSTTIQRVLGEPSVKRTNGHIDLVLKLGESGRLSFDAHRNDTLYVRDREGHKVEFVPLRLEVRDPPIPDPESEALLENSTPQRGEEVAPTSTETPDPLIEGLITRRLTGSNKTYFNLESSCKRRKQITQAASVFQASCITAKRS